MTDRLTNSSPTAHNYTGPVSEVRALPKRCRGIVSLNALVSQKRNGCELVYAWPCKRDGVMASKELAHMTPSRIGGSRT